MKISIIVPVYKVEKYIDKCINSIINQSYSNLEIILIDDGSPDNCGKICDDYAAKDSRIKVIHKENGGLSLARNIGIENSTGDYIMFVDSDDYIELTSCEELVNVIESTNACIVGFNFMAVDENYEDISDSRMYSLGNSKNITVMNYNNALIDNIYRKNIRYEAGSKIYKRDIILKNKFPLGMLAEDFAIFYKILKDADIIVHYDRQLYYYLQRKNSIMGSKNKKLYRDIYTTEKDFYLETKEICVLENDIKQAEIRHAKNLFKIYANLYSKTEDLEIQRDVVKDIYNLNSDFLSSKIKIILFVFKFNKFLFVKLFDCLYKKA